MHITTLRIDVAKNVFQLHGVDAEGRDGGWPGRRIIASTLL